MELYVKMTDEELEEFKKFKNNKNNPNSNLVNIKELSVAQLLNLKLKKVDSGIMTNPMTGFKEARTFFEDERKSVEVILITKEM